MKISETHMRRAIRNARKSTFNRFTLGAVLVSKNKAVADGFNLNKTHPVMLLTKQKAIHAEVCAVLRCPHTVDISSCHMYVARVTKSGALAQARPCVECQEYLKAIGVHHVHYTIDNNTIGTLYLKGRI